LVVGVIAAGLVARAIASLLFGVTPFHWPTFEAAIVILGFLALVASYLPARRATRVDPLIALPAQ
jgi:ABC-type antimicrobial peptide transport system permease subunit